MRLLRPRETVSELAKQPVTLRSLREQYPPGKMLGVRFYNQDWWLEETFATRPALAVFPQIPAVRDELRAQDPEWIAQSYRLPHAVYIARAFFCYWEATGKMLWRYDYLWTADVDRNGDRVYVGGYDLGAHHGFSVHRHLKITADYTAIVLGEKA